MSFFDDASLVFLPSGQAGKDGKAYSMKPTNGDGDFTFSRGSNLTATRVDSNGLIEKGRENLLLQSNSFDTTWTTDNSSVTSGQSGYDGSNDAWKLSGTGGFFPRVQQNKSISGVATFSVYAKSGNVNVLRLLTISGSNTDTKFQLTGSGSILTQTGSERIESKITRLGSTDWYRCSITFNGSPTNFRIYPMSDSSTFAVNGEFIYIQDAQLEQGLVATEYIESGASTGLAGILEDSPRFDYSGGTSCPSLLLEGSRSNLVEYSEYMLGSNWVGSFTTITPVLSDTLSPEGVANCYRITRSGSNIQLGSVVSITSGNTYTGSIYVRKVSGSDTAILKDVNNSSTSIDITTEWKRFHTTATATSGNGRLYIQPQSDGDVIEVFGAQLEEGSYPTSYIPNHSGGSVTREEDVNTLLNQSGVIGQTAGTILFDAYFDEAEKVNFSISDSTSSNFISIETTSSNEVTAKVEQGGSTQATITTATSFFAEGDRLKCAIAYDDRDMAFYINGTQVNTAAPNLIPACDDVRFGNYDGTIKADQRVNRVLLFDTRISNGNLATLTS